MGQSFPLFLVKKESSYALFGVVGSDPTPGAACNIPLMLTGGFSSAAAMNEALQSKAVDVIGLARPLCAMVHNWKCRGKKWKITQET